MATIVTSQKSCSINPLKSSAPLGAALAFLGVEGSVPLFHGAQGCTSLALVLAVRHFKETIPIQTTALNEFQTILGGADNLEQGILNVAKRMQPRLIGVVSTSLVETRGEDIAGELRLIRERQPDISGVELAFASAPDYDGALEDGWARAVSALIKSLVPESRTLIAKLPQVNILPGIHMTAADIEEIVEQVEAFGLRAVVLPDLSTSLDGVVPEAWVSTSLGGTPLDEITKLGSALHTIAVGEHMRPPAQLLQSRTGVEASVFPALTGLAASDALMTLLSRLSDRPVPPRIRRQRSRLIDAMLDGHFQFGGLRVAIAADPDLLYGFADFLSTMGAEIVTAVSSTSHSPRLSKISAERVIVGDLDDLESEAKAGNAELLITHSHGRQAARRLGLPLLRVGFPIFDRLGSAHRRRVGYRGTRDLIFEIANTVLSTEHGHEDLTPTHEMGREPPHASSTSATH